MKKFMMIVGAKILHTDDENAGMGTSIMEVFLLPLTNVKQEMNLQDASQLGFLKLDSLMNKLGMQKMTQEQDRILITTGEWRDRGYTIGKHITLEMLPDDTTGGIQ